MLYMSRIHLQHKSMQKLTKGQVLSRQPKSTRAGQDIVHKHRLLSDNPTLNAPCVLANRNVTSSIHMAFFIGFHVHLTCKPVLLSLRR
ncbi:hypothetical protein LY76DRAFT_25097 [Colletotrichum caudatum]|nr:hypothetical protein LY76DRAFT_25097 [Colletotrichum caudatum]